MDVYLKLLADAGLALADAEEAAGAGETGQATEAIDRAEEALTALREAWRDMAAGERAIVGPDRGADARAARPPAGPACRSEPPSAKGRPSRTRTRRSTPRSAA